MSQRLRRVNRLRNRSSFQRLFTEGERAANRYVLLLYLRQEGATRPRVGVAAGRRLGTAAVRNRVRRRLRELLRLRLPDLPAGADVVLVARAAVLRADASQLREAVDDVLRRAGLLARGEGRRPGECGPGE